MKAVLDTKPTSIYDDEIAEHYHFPSRYLSTIKSCLGDWVILRRPRADGGNLSYFALAKLQAIEKDTAHPGMSYARFSDYLSFDHPVPWRNEKGYSERALREIPQQQVGVYLRGRSVRLLEESDFCSIVLRGMAQSLNLIDSASVELGSPQTDALIPNDESFLQQRRVSQVLMNRLVRDARFRTMVCSAYEDRCALTRIRIMDSAGSSEVQAAHIVSVADNGPDIISNGIALSSTVHWLFDRYLISLTDDYRIIMDEKRVPPDIRELLMRHGPFITLPANESLRPSTRYIARHRTTFLQVSTSRL